MGQNTQYDIIKEKEQLIDKLQAEYEEKLDTSLTIEDWRLGFLLLFAVLGITLFLSGYIISATRWHPFVVFPVCCGGIATLILHFIKTIYEKPLKAKLENLDSQIEKQQIKLAQIKRRIG